MSCLPGCYYLVAEYVDFIFQHIFYPAPFNFILSGESEELLSPEQVRSRREIIEQSEQKPSWVITDGNFIVYRPHSSLCPDEPKKEIDCEEGVQEVGEILVNISEFKLSLRVLRHL